MTLKYTAIHVPTNTAHHRSEAFDSLYDFYRALVAWNTSSRGLWQYVDGHVNAGTAGAHSTKMPHENPNTRLLRVVVTVQDADKSWPAALDAFVELEAHFRLQGGIVPIQELVRRALVAAMT